MSEAHRPGPVSPRAVKRTGSCCATHYIMRRMIDADRATYGRIRFNGG
eukprot:COSAG02_NODE_46112_length_351_cov_1.230159_1_plen_47_part_10